jgi:hypothetical protein
MAARAEPAAPRQPALQVPVVQVVSPAREARAVLALTESGRMAAMVPPQAMVVRAVRAALLHPPALRVMVVRAATLHKEVSVVPVASRAMVATPVQEVTAVQAEPAVMPQAARMVMAAQVATPAVARSVRPAAQATC